MKKIIFLLVGPFLIPQGAFAWTAVRSAGECESKNVMIRYLAAMSESDGFYFDSIQVVKNGKLQKAKLLKKATSKKLRIDNGADQFPNRFTLQLDDGSKLGVVIPDSTIDNVTASDKAAVYVIEPGAKEKKEEVSCASSRDDKFISSIEDKMKPQKVYQEENSDEEEETGSGSAL